MVNYMIDLQLFADEGAEGAPATETETAEKATDEKSAAADQKKDAGKTKTKELKYSDDDLDEIINKKFAKWEANKQKAVDEAKKLAEMDAQQRAEYERDQLKKELEELKKKDSLAEMTKVARKMLTDDGISISDELLSVMVTTDAEETKTAITGFKTAFKEAVENTVKERLRGEPPKRGTGGAAALTKEQIMSIKDPELRQKKMLENRDLFHF